MKEFRFIFLIIALFFSGFSNESTWVIDSESKLAIHGESNINTFTCEVNSYSGHDTLQFFKNYAASALQFTAKRMSIPIKSFDCGSKKISKDFWKTLRSEEYPQLDINFISLQGTSIKNGSLVKGIVDITLAGITARYNIAFDARLKNGVILLSGTHPVNFADFGLKAPQKLRGLIRVKEVLHVEFNLVLKAI
jgi:hypothetical protein